MIKRKQNKINNFDTEIYNKQIDEWYSYCNLSWKIYFELNLVTRNFELKLQKNVSCALRLWMKCKQSDHEKLNGTVGVNTKMYTAIIWLINMHLKVLLKNKTMKLIKQNFVDGRANFFIDICCLKYP